MPRGTAGNGQEFDASFEERAGEIAKAVLDALPAEGAHGCALLLRRAVALLESGCLPSPRIAGGPALPFPAGPALTERFRARLGAWTGSRDSQARGGLARGVAGRGGARGRGLGRKSTESQKAVSLVLTALRF
jgi:hypothetical protein